MKGAGGEMELGKIRGERAVKGGARGNGKWKNEFDSVRILPYQYIQVLLLNQHASPLLTLYCTSVMNNVVVVYAWAF